MDVNYKPTPTAKRFHQDPNFVRGLLGPLGCLSADTEFLTEKGWKRVDQYEEGDKVAQWWPDTKTAEFVEPQRYIKEPCNEMWHFYTKKSLSMILSDEHRVPYYDYKGKFQVEYADNVGSKPSRRQVPINFIPETKGIDLSEDWIRLAVAIHADGSFQHGPECSFGLRKERKKERLRQLLQKLNIDWREHTNPKRPTETNFYFQSAYIGKHYTEEWYQCSQEQLKTVVDEIQYWDGLFRGPDTRYFTTYKSDADFIQYAVHATGGRATICKGDEEERGWNTCYSVHIALEGSRKQPVSIRENTSIDRVVTKDGFKYCFEVPSSYFVVRHNGCVFVTGNSGKSVACVMEMLRLAYNQEPFQGYRFSRNAIIRSSYPELKSTTIKTFQEWIPHSVCPIKMDSPISGRMRLPDIGDGTGIDAEFIFLALDQPKDIEKLKSLELTFAWINECSGVRQEMFDMLTLRVGRFPPKKWGGPTRAGVIMDSNMVDDMHWLYQVAEEETPDNYAFYRQPPAVLRDPETNEYKINPEAENIENLGEEYYLRAIPGKRWDWINVFLMANWGSVVEGKPVYPEWQDHLHVSSKELKPTKGLPVVVGFDFGLSPAAIFVQLTPDGQIHILDELVTTQRMGIRRFMQDMFIPKITNRFFEHNLLLYGDPSGVRKAESDETTCFHEMANMGYPCEPAESNALEARLNAVAGFLNKMVDGKPAMQLDKRCQFLRKGFNGAYHYKRMQTRSSESGTMDKFKDEPEKNDFSHPHDALQYACLAMEGKSQRRSTQRAHRQKKQPASKVAGY